MYRTHPQHLPPHRTFTTLLVALGALVGSALPAHAQAEPRLVTPGEQTSGALLLATDTEGKFIPAPALMTDVEIDISGPIARTQVTQRFENTSDTWVEGIYVFPLPDESAVDTLRLQIGDRFIEGQIKEREEARQIYQTAKAEGRKAGLMEQQRANIFTNNVANIGPGETVVVQIEYQETVHLDDGQFSLRFPMVVAPRYSPAPKVMLASIDQSTGWAIADPVPDRADISPPYNDPNIGAQNPVRLTIDIDAGFPIGVLNSSFHDMETLWDGDARAMLSLQEGSVPANRDFELTWSPKTGGSPRAALFNQTVEGEDYFLLMITPPDPQLEISVPAREVTFIIDTSGSMGGESIRQARQSLAMAVSRLEASDTFNVIEFNSFTRPMFKTPRPADASNKRAALQWVEGLEATGGTEMLPALQTALNESSLDRNKLRQIIFLTDGAIGNEQELFDLIANQRADARIFTIGIGSAPNSFFMSRAAELGRGTFTHIGSIDQVADRMSALFTKLEAPAITDIDIAWPQGTTVDTSFTLIPDVYQGETLSIAAKVAPGLGDVVVSGTSDDEAWQVTLDLEQASERDGISKLWARKKIASLELDRLRQYDARNAIDNDILQIALDHHLLSRLTSLVAVDITPERPADVELVSRHVPLDFPEGWDFQKVFGDETHMQVAPIPVALDGIEATEVERSRAEPIALPGTATLSQLKLILGVLTLLLGLMAWRRLKPAAQ